MALSLLKTTPFLFTKPGRSFSMARCNLVMIVKVQRSFQDHNAEFPPNPAQTHNIAFVVSVWVQIVEHIWLYLHIIIIVCELPFTIRHQRPYRWPDFVVSPWSFANGNNDRVNFLRQLIWHLDISSSFLYPVRVFAVCVKLFGNACFVSWRRHNYQRVSRAELLW